MLYLQIASPKSSVLNFLDSNSFEVIISIFQRTEKVPDMERLRIWRLRIDDQATYTIIKNYIEKKEGNDRLLLLFLFNYISYIEIDGYTYFRNENPHPVKPLRNACLALFPELSRYLYDNACIPDMQDKTLLRFLRHFTALKFWSISVPFVLLDMISISLPEIFNRVLV